MQKFFIFPLFFVLVLIFIAFIGLGEPLWDQDEAAYYGFASQMVISNDWIVPDFPISSPHRKTPLHFWTSGILMKVFGMELFNFRFMNTIYFILTGILVFLLTHSMEIKNKLQLSFFATIVYFSSIFLIIYQRIALTDISLMFFSLFGLYCFWKAVSFSQLENKETKSLLNKRIIWIAGFWSALSLGVLQKGPPILILLGGVFFIFLLLSKNRRILIQFHPWLFLPISLLPLFIWGRLAWIATDGVIIRWMVDWYIMKRATGSVFGQSGPPGTYLILFFFFFFPWSLSLFSVFINLKQEIISLIKGERSDRFIFILGWLLSGWIFYEVLPSKLPSYTLSVFPLLSILIARSWIYNPVKSLQTQVQVEKSIHDNSKSVIFKLKLITVLGIGVIWMAILLYIQLNIDGKFLQLAWNSTITIGFLYLTILYVLIVFYQNRKEIFFGIETSKKINIYSSTFFKIASGMLIFHAIFGMLYYPSLSNSRDYGNKLSNNLFHLLNSTEMDLEALDHNVTFKKLQTGKPIVIHPSISLPSIITSLTRKGFPASKIIEIESEQELIQDFKMQEAIYLAPKYFLDILQLLGHKTESKCLNFFSYESGNHLDLCWIIKTE